MIDNEKVKEVYKEWINSKADKDLLHYCEDITNYGETIECYGFFSGYAARDKEAEEEKRELIEALINLYPTTIYRNYEGGISYDKEVRAIIEKHTGKPIDEVIK